MTMRTHRFLGLFLALTLAACGSTESTTEPGATTTTTVTTTTAPTTTNTTTTAVGGTTTSTTSTTGTTSSTTSTTGVGTTSTTATTTGTTSTTTTSTTTTTTTTAPNGFAATVMPHVNASNCITACHSSAGGGVGAANVFTDATSAFNFAFARSVDFSPSTSVYFKKTTGSGGTSHGGGAQWASGTNSAAFNAVTNWINGGRKP